MAAGYVSGETMLRPVRMGLAIMPGSAAGLRRAVELAVGSWGGQAFPIVEAAADPRAALRLAGAMGVDCLFPVGDDDELKVLAKAPGFEWVASWQGLSPFNRHWEGRGEHVLPASALYDWYRLSRLPQPTVYHVSWPQDHALADLLAVWFGCFGSDDGQADRAAFEAVAQGCPLGPGLSAAALADVDRQPAEHHHAGCLPAAALAEPRASWSSRTGTSATWSVSGTSAPPGRRSSPGWKPKPISWKSRSRNGLRRWPRQHQRFQVGCPTYPCGSRTGTLSRPGSVHSSAPTVSSSCPNPTTWTCAPPGR